VDIDFSDTVLAAPVDLNLGSILRYQHIFLKAFQVLIGQPFLTLVNVFRGWR
jgi:hypothetical protein